MPFFRRRARFFRPRRKTGPLPLKYVLLLTFIFFAISTMAGLWIVNKSLKPALLAYAESQTMQIASFVINRAVMETKVEDINNVITVDPETSLTRFDTEKIYEKLGETTETVITYLRKMENGTLPELDSLTDFDIDLEKSGKGKGVVYSIPIGQATNNVILGSMGPKIPVRFHLIGDLEPDIETNFKEAGINNVFMEVNIVLKVNVQVIIPFATETAQLEQRIPIAMGMIRGDVPRFYNRSGSGVQPSILLPVDE
ncbi:MAG: sporulation protein YunB [Firmicutes bacterium]|nr:sporulation protein YunB [Bacillota bacterium]